MEKGYHFLRQHREDPKITRHAQAFDLLSQAVVYELSDVAPFFHDWEREREKVIPKRPPHDLLWSEWGYRHHDGTTYIDFLLGLFLKKTSRSHLESRWSAAAYDALDPLGSSEPLDNFDEFYLGEMFRYVKGGTSPAVPEMAPSRVHIDFGGFLFLLRNNGSQLRGTKVFSQAFAPYLFDGKKMDDDFLCAVEERAQLFGCDVDFLPLDSSSHQVRLPWIPFMAFGLLHCKNVVQEDHVPDARLQRQVQRAGNPPRVSYKTLRIQVPQTSHQKQSLDPGDDENGPKVRFHLCSGHFKNLQHARYKNKGWHWWPAHWRGSKDLGEVHKTYQLTPSV